MIITHSSLECFKTCRRKYKLRYKDGIVPKIKSSALEFGSAMHLALEQYFKLISSNQTFGNTDIESISEEILTSIGNTVDLLKLDIIEKAKLMSLMSGYIKKWFEHDYSEFEVIAVEKEFSIPNSPLSTFVGKVDGLVKLKSTGEYFLVEHKTASIVDQSYRDQKKIDSQTMTYAIFLEQQLGIKVSGCIHDILTKQKIKQKKGETESDFCDRLFLDVTDDNFERIIITFDSIQLEIFKFELFTACKDLIDCQTFYKCTGSCLGKYGACEYLPICQTGKPFDLKEMCDRFDVNRPFEEISQETIDNAKLQN